MTTERAAHIAGAVVCLGLVQGPLYAADVRRSWLRVVDHQPLTGRLDYLLSELHRLHVDAGHIGRIDDWLTESGRRPAGLRRHKS